MSQPILKLQSENLKSPIGATGIIKKQLSSNSVWNLKSNFEQFITTQPGMMDLLERICQSLTYNDSKSVENVTKDFQAWISNSEIFRLAHEADLAIDKAIATRVSRTRSRPGAPEAGPRRFGGRGRSGLTL